MKTVSTSRSIARKVILAPRHGSTVQSPSAAKAARALAKKRGKALVSSHSRKVEAEMESASDWNSILLTARAQRGPQWDVMTQQFLVDHGSPLFYNHTALFPNLGGEEKPKDEGEIQPPQDSSLPSQNQPIPEGMQVEVSNTSVPQQQQFLPQQVTFAPNNYMTPAAANGFGSDFYIPPDVMRNPRRTTRGMNGREGMYRV